MIWARIYPSIDLGFGAGKSHRIAFVLRFDNKYLGPFRKIKDVTDSNVAVHCFLC